MNTHHVSPSMVRLYRIIENSVLSVAVFMVFYIRNEFSTPFHRLVNLACVAC